MLSINEINLLKSQNEGLRKQNEELQQACKSLEQECENWKKELDKEHLLMLEKHNKLLKYILAIDEINNILTIINKAKDGNNE